VITEEKRSENSLNHFAFVVNDNQVTKKKISVGISDDGFQQITKGLSTSDIVALGPDKTLRHLKNNDAVTINEQSE
jgi:hypothetical protein